MSYDIERKLIYTKEESGLIDDGVEFFPAETITIYLNDLDEIEITKVLYTKPVRIQHFKLDRVLRDLIANAKWES